MALVCLLGLNSEFRYFPGGGWWVRESENKAKLSQLKLEFGLSLAKNKDMFPLNDKNHQMETRNADKYKVQYANTERLKTFALIYMQNLLNEHEDKK